MCFSFGKGDVFVVQNEMEDGWLWVTSERTKESGLVPAPFVKDLVCVICVSDMCIGRWDGVEKKKNLWRLSLIHI